MTYINETHDPALKSWVASANASETDFPIQNLPLGIFRKKGSSEAPRGGVAIGDQILDIGAAQSVLSGAAAEAADLCTGSSLNALMAAGPSAWSALRKGLSEALREGGPADQLSGALTAQTDAEMFVPADIGDYTDFYASINHATNAGKMFRPDNPLLPNYKYIPIGYHGRASSIVVSGTPVKRPLGQRKAPDAEAPTFGPCVRLDYELELGAYVGPGNGLGQSIPLKDADGHLFGCCLLNDWSARDIQAWEYVPLGPFLGKSFNSVISPWIVMLEALAPFRVPAYARPDGDPQPLDYLKDANDAASGGLDIQLEVCVASSKMREQGMDPMRIGLAPFKDMYWTLAQMITHHSSNGCNMQPGDFFGSGTCSGTTPDSYGSLLEKTLGGSQKFDLPTGEARGFLEDGDEVVMRGFCEAPGAVRIGFGECRAVIEPAG